MTLSYKRSFEHLAPGLHIVKCLVWERLVGYVGGRELAILLFECVVGEKCYVCDAFSFPPGVYVGS